jgi:hypothetical protein
MNAEYYRSLARDLMADAAAAENPTIAARLRERAQEYLQLAEAVEGSSEPPTSNQQAPKKDAANTDKD